MRIERPIPAAAIGVRGTRGLLAQGTDLLVLTKPRIGSFVFLAAFVGAHLAGGPGGRLAPALEAAFWILCTAASSSVFNMLLEIDVDRRMERTRGRPLVTGRVRPREAVLLGAGLGVAGVLGLALRANLLAALLALASLAAYALVYTPLKRHTPLNTVVGAIPGAMPPLLGYVAVAGAPETWGWMLFAILFAWQFPHFMAIAWLYREDYARAELKMLPAIPGTEGLAGRQALAYALVLLLISLLPTLRGDAGLLYGAGALVLGLLYAGASACFAREEAPARARAVLYASLAYLPLVFSLTLLDPAVHRALG